MNQTNVLALLLAALLCSTLVLCVQPIDPQFFKKVQGPPEEFPLHQLPVPMDAAHTSSSALFPLSLLAKDNVWEWSGELPIDSAEAASITIVTQIAEENFEVSIRDPETLQWVPLAIKMPALSKKPAQIIRSWFGITEEKSVPTYSYAFEKPTPGSWTVRIVSKTEPKSNSKRGNGAPKPHLFLIVENMSEYKSFGHLGGASYEQLRVGEQVVVQTRLFDERAFIEAVASLKNAQDKTPEEIYRTERRPRGVAPKGISAREIKQAIANSGVSDPLAGLNEDVYLYADMDVIMPDGEEKVITMHDDGMHADNAASDGVFAGIFTASQEGHYDVSVVMRGVTPKGHVFVRTTQHLFQVVENDKLKIQSQARAKINSEDEMMKISLLASFPNDVSKEAVVGQKFIAYAEVHGSAIGTDSLVPVAYTSGMAIATLDSADASNTVVSLELELSMKWLSRAKATLPLQLRNIYIQDANLYVPVATSASVDIPVANVLIENNGKSLSETIGDYNRQPFIAVNYVNQLVKRNFAFNIKTDAITEQMTFGKRPVKYSMARLNGNDNEEATLLLVHGYCAGSPPFSTEQFTNYAIFDDLNQNRKNDEFALLLREFADQFPKVSVVAHSQGGLAMAHLYNFYWSSKDVTVLAQSNNRNSTNGARLLQSVGSPYLGSGLAGNLAALGDIFGVGCGTNFDLSHEGAELWVATISQATRAQIYYYTSQYKDWSWCNFGSNLVLDLPNDGTTELKYSKLEGANNLGHTKSECHTLSMKYPPQCKNPTRNTEINDNAAR